MGITPKGVEKRIKDMIDGVYDIDQERTVQKAAQVRAKYAAMPEKDLEKELRQIEKQMLDAAKNLEFERAAELRDGFTSCARPVRRRAAHRDLIAGDVRVGHLAAPLPFAVRIATSMSRYFHENPNGDGQ
jgi:excinuclease UvrABC nuclease subunit